MRKTWLNPSVEELNINATACGGPSVTEHDGCIYEIKVDGNKVSVEEYLPASGDHSTCGNPNK